MVTAETKKYHKHRWAYTMTKPWLAICVVCKRIEKN